MESINWSHIRNEIVEQGENWEKKCCRYVRNEENNRRTKSGLQTRMPDWFFNRFSAFNFNLCNFLLRSEHFNSSPAIFIFDYLFLITSKCVRPSLLYWLLFLIVFKLFVEFFNFEIWVLSMFKHEFADKINEKKDNKIDRNLSYCFLLVMCSN